MMNKSMRFMTLMAMTAATLVAMGASATSSQQARTDPPKAQAATKELPEHHKDMADMSAMMNGPHQVLAMAYRDNIVIFALALRQQAKSETLLDPAFAKSAVAEMKRSFDQMQGHSKDHLKSVSPAMRTQMATTIASRVSHHAALQSDLTLLEEEVKSSTPDAKVVSQLVDDILERCDAKVAMKSAAKDATQH